MSDFRPWWACNANPCTCPKPLPDLVSVAKGAEAHDCLMRGHEEQLENLRRQLEKERERVAWLERNYGDPL